MRFESTGCSGRGGAALCRSGLRSHLTLACQVSAQQRLMSRRLGTIWTRCGQTGRRPCRRSASRFAAARAPWCGGRARRRRPWAEPARCGRLRPSFHQVWLDRLQRCVRASNPPAPSGMVSPDPVALPRHEVMAHGSRPNPPTPGSGAGHPADATRARFSKPESSRHSGALTALAGI